MDNFVYLAYECILTLLASIYASADVTNCINEYCFTYSGANVTRKFDGAESWCKSNDSSTLAFVSNESSHDALIQFLPSSKFSSIYINAKVDLISDPNTWHFVNGDQFNGNVEDQTDIVSAYKFYTYLQKWSPLLFHIFPSRPQELKNYICEYKDESGLNILPNTNYSHNEAIYVKYENETLNWFEARYRCFLKGGDLATFPDLSNFNTSWLNLSYSYWIGFRRNYWRWKTTYNDQEVIYTRWSKDKPSNSALKCICIDKSSSWNWTDCDCNIPRSFVCVKYRHFSTTTSTSTTTSSTVASQTRNYVNGTLEGSTSPSLDNLNLAIGVGVGVGGGILLIILVVVVVVVRKKRKSNQGTTERIKTTKDEATPKHKLKKPKDRKVVKKTDNVAVYADITPITQPIDREPTSGPIIYAYPEFVGSSV